MRGKTMTHDELLDRIAQAGLEPHGNIMPTHLVLALRAVVELHKPDIYETCVECTRGISPSIAYPCPTIQAIEKELG
jgi:hypothetical protein